MAELMMKVLVSLTKEAFDQYSFLEDQTQLFDFTWVDDAMEVLTLPTIVCDGPAAHRISCGCGRSFGSIDSCKVTTLGLVTYAQVDALKERLRQSKQVESWGEDLFDSFWKSMLGLSEAIARFGEGDVIRIQSEPTEYVVYPSTNGPQDVLGILTDKQKAIKT